MAADIMEKIMYFISDLPLIIKLAVFSVYSYLHVFFSNIYERFFASHSLMHLKGEIVLITGAAGGIGKCMVKKIMALDAVVVCVDVDRDALTELEKELKTQFPHKFASSTKNAHFYCTDITSIQQIKVLGNSVRNQIGEVSVLVNNAGIVNHGKYLLELSDEEIRKIFDVNILSYFWMSREFLPSMLKKNRGHILNMSSVCGYAGNAGLIDYCSTKFAVQGFSHSLRVELKSMNPGNQIKVSVISPLLVNTNLIQGARLLHMKWLNLFIEPDYVAEEITNGILFKKEVIPVPRIETRLIHFLTKILTADASDYFQTLTGIDKSVQMLRKSQ